MSDDFQSTPAPPPPAPPAPPMAPPAGVPSDTGKILAALSYIFWPVVGIIALLLDPYKDEKFVRAHAIQSLALGLAIYVIGGVLSAVLIGFVLIFAGAVYQIVLAVQAFQGKWVEIPVIYNLVKNYI